MTAPGQAPSLRAADFGLVPGLQRPINDALKALSDRLAVLEVAGGRVIPLEPFAITTGGTTTIGNAPFPVRVTLPRVPGRGLVGVVVLRTENLTVRGVGGMTLSAHGVEWEPTADEQLVIQYISSLQITCSYVVTLGAVYV